jgi:hypothetical protein
MTMGSFLVQRRAIIALQFIDSDDNKVPGFFMALCPFGGGSTFSGEFAKK